MSNKKPLYIAIATLGLGLAGWGAYTWNSKPSGPKEMSGAGAGSGPARVALGAASAASGPRPAAVEVAKVESAAVRDDAQAVGTLRARQSTLVRPEVSGRIVALGFQDGARVRRGQMMVQLDDSLQRAEVKQSMAQLGVARANVRRNQDLVAQGFVSQRVVDEAQANMQVIEAQMSLSCARLTRMRIDAPFDGFVGIRNVNVGDFVKDGADLVALEDIGSLFVDFRLPERFAPRVKRDQIVELALDAFPGRAFKAKVEAIEPSLDASGRSVAVRASLPNTVGEGARPAGAPRGAVGASAPRPAAMRMASPAAPRGRSEADAAAPQSEELRACASLNAPAARPLSAASGTSQRTRSASAPAAASGGGPLRPGMFARVTTVFATRDAALLVPEEAIVPQAGRQFVIRVVDRSAIPGTATAALPLEITHVSQRLEVKLGVRRAGKVEVELGSSGSPPGASGPQAGARPAGAPNVQPASTGAPAGPTPAPLREGDTIVTAGQQRLQRDGTPVRIVELNRAAGPPAGAASATAPSGAPAPSAVASNVASGIVR